jgi:hypothetical protein
MKNKITLELHRRQKDGKYKATTDTLEQMERATAEKLYFEQVTKGKHRSNQQNKLYFGQWLPVILYYLPEGLIEPHPEGCNDLHELFMWGFTIQRGEVKITIYKGKEYPQRKSWSFDNMPAKTANEFLCFVKKWVINNIGSDIETLMIEKHSES